MTKNTKLLFLVGIMGVVIIVLGFLFLSSEGINPNSKNNISEEEKEFNESGQAKAIIDETDLWKIYDVSLLQGKWLSLDDTKSEIEFIGNKKIDYYSEEKLFEADFEVLDNKITVKDPDGDFKYEIINLTGNSLEMIYLDRGNILRFIKKNNSKN